LDAKPWRLCLSASWRRHANTNPNRNPNSYCDGNGYCNSNSYCNSNKYANTRLKVYSNATASPNTAAAAIGIFLLRKVAGY
jgi:hypothetical protein